MRAQEQGTTAAANQSTPDAPASCGVLDQDGVLSFVASGSSPGTHVPSFTRRPAQCQCSPSAARLSGPWLHPPRLVVWDGVPVLALRFIRELMAAMHLALTQPIANTRPRPRNTSSPSPVSSAMRCCPQREGTAYLSPDTLLPTLLPTGLPSQPASQRASPSPAHACMLRK